MSTNLYERAGWAGVLLSAALLSACGGGGDSADPAPQPTVQPTAIPDNLSITAPASSDVTAGTSFTSNAAALTGLSFAWSFGDGSGSTEASPKHDYAKVGDYEVTLRVSNTAGASKELKYKVSVNNRAHVKGLACSAAADSGWCWQQPRPTGTSREDYFFLDAQTGWSVGDNGEIFKTVDGGKTWAHQQSGLRSRLLVVGFADANNGWVMGSYGALLRTTDGGKTWIQQDVGSGIGRYYELHVLNANAAVVVNSDGSVRRTMDGGKTWTENRFAVTEVGADGVLWQLDSNSLKKSADGGATSTVVATVSNTYSQRFQLLTNQTLVISGVVSTYDASQGRTIYKLNIRRSLDGGTSWESYEGQGLSANDVSSLSTVEFVDANIAYFSTYSGQVYRTVDGGRNWTTVGAPTTGNWGSGGYARVLEGDTLYRSSSYFNSPDQFLSEDGGASWIRISSPADGNLNRVAPQRLGAKTWLWAEGDRAFISQDGMQSWVQVGGVDAKLAQRSLLATWFFDTKRGLGLNASGELQETANGGTEWTTKVKNLVAPSYGGAAFQFVGSKGWLLAGDGKIYRSTDSGTNWATPLLGRLTFNAFHFTDENTGFALAYDPVISKSVLLASSDGGQSWSQKAELPMPLRSLQFSNAKKGLAVGAGGRILSTEDGGQTWVTRFSGTEAYLNRVLFTDANTAWAIGDNGTALKSTDAGQTWIRQLTSTTSNLNGIRFLDAQQGWIVGSGGTVLATNDGGKSWTTQFTGTQKTLNEVFFVDGRTGWVTGTEGTILATGTGGF